MPHGGWILSQHEPSPCPLLDLSALYREASCPPPVCGKAPWFCHLHHPPLGPLVVTWPRSTYFSVEINHGGYFLGSGRNRSYVDGAAIWFDNIDSVTWSPLMVENLVEEIGYEMQGRVKVHYLIPILTMDMNGLRQIRDEDDTAAMLKFVDIGHHFISLYLDHDESIRSMNWDDVIHFPVAELPPIISPCKPLQTVNGDVENVHENPVPIQMMHPEIIEEDRPVRREGLRPRSNVRPRINADQEEEQVSGSSVVPMSDEEDDPDYEIIDSEYGISEDDDDLDADNAEEAQGQAEQKIAMKGKAKQEVSNDGCDTEEEDLWAPDSDDDNVEFRFKTFRQEDLKCVKFSVGQTFESVHMVRQAIREYSCQNRWDIKLPVNDLKRIKAKCVGGEKKECIVVQIIVLDVMVPFWL